MRWLTGMMLVSYAASAVAQQPVARHRSPSTPDGVIATAAHVVHGANVGKVRFPSGESFEVQGVIAMDEVRDFALLRIAGFGLPTAPLGNSDSVAVGAHLLAFGAPLGFEATVSDGLLSAARLKDGTRLFQISVPISPGSSGGPLATDDGLVVGIVVATWKEEGAQNLNFALPINYLRGQIPLASSKTPIPLSQMSYGPPQAPGEAASATIPAPPGTPARVNDSLGIDWKVLDGAQVRVETKGDQGARRTNIAEYALSRTLQGSQALERTTVERAWQTGDIFSGRKGGTWYEDNTRTVIGLGTSRVEFYWRRSPASSQIPPGSLTLTLDGGMAVVDSGSIHRTAVVPRGALPSAVLGALVAALPDSLPNSVYVWLFTPSSASLQAEPVRVDFATSGRMKVPIARPGTHCSMNSLDENTEDVTVDAIQMTATLGPDRLTWPILAQRPHLRLDAKCLRVPNFDRRK